MTEERPPVSPDSRGRERGGHDGQGHRHAGRACKQQRLASRTIDERDGGDRGQNVDEAREQIDTQGPLLRHPDRFPQHLAVIEDDVDAHELLKRREPYAEPDDRGEPMHASNKQVRQARPLLAAQGLLDLPN